MVNQKLYLTDGDYILALKKEECIPLELKLNITRYGFDWKHIGDALYKYGNRYKPNSTKIHVTSQQLSFLIKIFKMSKNDLEKMVENEIKNPE
jgi:hypothetical protein